jgi:hypothetical protein
MTQDLPEKPAETPPFAAHSADSKPHMSNASHGLRFEPRDLRDPKIAIEALAHWDELDPSSLALLEKHPVHGPRLAMLRAADAWLTESAASARSVRPTGESRAVWETAPLRPVAGDRALYSDETPDCPRAEDLYDYGRGPGYAPLTPALRASIDRHLAHCRRCETLVETLSAPPPTPLALDDDAATIAVGEMAHDEHDFDSVSSHSNAHDDSAAVEARLAPNPSRRPESAPRAIDEIRAEREAASVLSTASVGARDDFVATKDARTSTSRPRRWIPLAAAASLIAGASVWFAWNASESRPLKFPESPLLRGTTTGSLLFPREHVLRATPEIVRIWPALGERLSFEIQPEAAAESYWIELSKHDGSAFGANESVWKETSTGAAIAAKSELPAGNYTWEAWAVVHGLDQQLGRRDFDVVDDAGLRAKLLALAPLAEPERSLAAVRVLHERGYRTDARRIARNMPPSPERDEYLARVPGR